MPLRSLLLSLVLLLAAGISGAATDPFSGNWKLDPSRSKLFDEMKVAAAGPNTYALDFGGGNTETIVANGTDQPGLYGTTFAITVLDDHHLKCVRKKDGQTTISAIWELSPDGSTLTDHFTGYRADGTTSNLLYTYARAAGSFGFAGTWDSVETQVSSKYEMQIEPYDNDGLSFINAAQKMTRKIKFDGKDYAGQGPNLPAGFVTSGHRTSDRALELTDKINVKVMDTQQLEISADGQSLTITTNLPGRTKPNIQVFVRE